MIQNWAHTGQTKPSAELLWIKQLFLWLQMVCVVVFSFYNSHPHNLLTQSERIAAYCPQSYCKKSHYLSMFHTTKIHIFSVINNNFLKKKKRKCEKLCLNSKLKHTFLLQWYEKHAAYVYSSLPLLSGSSSIGSSILCVFVFIFIFFYWLSQTANCHFISLQTYKLWLYNGT